MKRSVIHSNKVPPAKVPLSQGIKVGDWIYTSGRLGMDPATGQTRRPPGQAAGSSSK